jgi:hypothetical protein
VRRDKVLGFIRETLLHENLVDSLSVSLADGEVRFNLIQPNQDHHQYPDPELLLTFSGVQESSVRSGASCERRGETVLGIECIIEGRLYRAIITVGDSSAVSWSIEVIFADLRYRRS